MKNEVWKDIEGFDNYQVSNLGRVINIKKRLVMKQRPTKAGYLQVRLYKDGIPSYLFVHRLVCKHFLSTWDPELQVDHIDEDKTNNNVTNLRMVTQHENTKLRNKKLGPRGVRQRRGKWEASIKFEGKRIHIGVYDSEDFAHFAFYQKFKELHGEAPW